MPNLLHFTYAILSLILIIFSCTFFTNAIEHLGKRLNLGNNVTGSILAVIGTTLPETVVPLVAIFGAMIVGGDISIGQEIAIGAITGSPFMLSTFALFVLGLTICFRNNKDIETNISNVLRNYKYIIFAYIIALCGAFISNGKIKIAFAIFLVLMYAFFVLRTFLNSEDENKND